MKGRKIYVLAMAAASEAVVVAVVGRPEIEVHDEWESGWWALLDPCSVWRIV